MPPALQRLQGTLHAALGIALFDSPLFGLLGQLHRGHDQKTGREPLFHRRQLYLTSQDAVESDLQGRHGPAPCGTVFARVESAGYTVLSAYPIRGNLR
ncbi:hypothetical protein CMI47_02940 [Candidatus Pacearchaeota archaeon]|nr:hypothetical protein [Candidatus Pacearchaeota archaeon]